MPEIVGTVISGDLMRLRAKNFHQMIRPSIRLRAIGNLGVMFTVIFSLPESRTLPFFLIKNAHFNSGPTSVPAWGSVDRAILGNRVYTKRPLQGRM